MNVDKVIAKAIPGKGTGLYAVEKCEAGSTLMYIPINYAINRGSLIRLIKKNPSLRWPTADSIREMTEAQAITLYILICRYLMSSPRFQWENPAPGYHIDYVNNSLFAVQPSAAYMWQLAPHQLISIENTVLHDAINAKLNSLEREHEFASRELLDPLAQSLSATDSDAPPYPDIDLEAYKKARWLVLSRAFSFESAFLEHERKLSGSNDLHLVPQIDYANHSFTPNAKFKLARELKSLNSKPTHICAFAINDIPACTEVTIQYAPAIPNAELLFAHGFCMPNNPHNNLAIPSVIEPSFDMWADVKNSIMQQCGLSPVVKLKSNPVPVILKDIRKAFIDQQSLCMLILAFMEDSDFIRMKFGTDDDGRIVMMDQVLNGDNLRLLETFIGRKETRDAVVKYIRMACEKFTQVIPERLALLEAPQIEEDPETAAKSQAIRIYLEDQLHIAGSYLGILKE